MAKEVTRTTSATSRSGPGDEEDERSRETLPSSARQVQDAAADAEVVEHHSSGFGDAEGTNPERSQDSTGDP